MWNNSQKASKKEKLNTNEINYFKYYENHRKFVQIQKENFKNQIKNIPDDQCILIINFKQNFKIGGGPIETQKDFYTKTFLSYFGICIIYKELVNIKKKYHNYLSEILSHDSLFVKEVLDKFLNNEIENKFSCISIWCDNGKHFSSGELMQYLQSFCNKKYNVVTINFFGEYRGKSHVDGHFGVLQKALNDAENTIYINSIYHLISLFSSKISNNYYFLKK